MTTTAPPAVTPAIHRHSDQPMATAQVMTTRMQGTILAFSGITMGTGASLDGRAISLVGGPVTTLTNLINVPAP